MSQSAANSVPYFTLGPLYRGLCSTRVAVFLFLAICLLVIPGTADASLKELLSPVVSVLLGLMGLSTFACTVSRIKTLHLSVLVIHAGVIVTLAGAVASGFGSVATVNIYEGGSVSEAYRWDLKADTPLGFDLLVKKIGTEYYRTPVKVGVLQGEQKVALFTTATGESFNVGGFQATVGELDPVGKKLHLTISQGGQLIGAVDTSSLQQLPGGFPYQFRLVSYKTPKLKRMWVDLALLQGGHVITEGISEVNGPLQWEGVDLFHTKSSRDADGRPYAGIQLVRDPGRPIVFAGLVLVSVGALLTVSRRLFGKGRGGESITFPGACVKS